ncbi:MAG: CoA transferase, partial [Acidimicrobiales bacterium]
MVRAEGCLPCHSLPTGSPDWLSDLLTAPLRLDDQWPDPTEPFAVADGWVHVEVTEEEQATFEALAEQWQTLDAERFAAACQELRLPVCPYRAAHVGDRTLPAGRGSVDGDLDNASTGRSPASSVAGSLVIDLTTHWAGPLATKLLADAGATVIKLDPECRPDGFRQRPALYQHLNGDKEVLDLDLRRPADRTQFEALLAKADLLVESFSRRVMPNLGYGSTQLAKLAPRLKTLSIKAFPIRTPEQDWLA